MAYVQRFIEIMRKSLFVQNLNFGYTLIELLVVIVIIVILLGISTFGIQGARESARDGRRKSDLEAIRSALEIYKADCGVYPTGAPTPPNALTGACPSSSTYMSEYPGDPNGSDTYTYNNDAPNNTYELCTALEGGGSDSCSSGCSGCNYVVTSP